MLYENGYDIKILNTINFKKSMKYNPFAYLRSEKDILKLVQTIIANTKGDGEKAGEDFWVKAEKLYYTALIGYIYYEAPEEEKNFATLLDMIDASEVREDDETYMNPIDRLFEALEKREPTHFAVKQYKKYKLAAGKTAKSILISCGARLAPFDIRELRELMSEDELELDTLGDRKTALFVIISDTDDTFNFVVSIMYSQLFNLLCDKADDVYGGRLPVHVRCLLDEFANIGLIPKFEKLIATIRSREISASIILQAQSQLKAIYKDNADTIVGNCDSTLFLGGKEKTTLKELSMNGFTLSTDKIGDEITAEQLINLIDDNIEITDVIQKEKITKPDLPFDLTTLQRECNKYFGYSAKQTLDYAQSLYEKKLITYPRTDSRCLTEDMIVSTVNNILGKNDFDTERIKTVFNSKNVTDHHAIIPTVSSLSEDLSSIPDSESKVYRLISNKLHASVGYPLVENTTKIVAEFDGFEFTSSGKVIKDEGFSQHLKEYKSKKSEDAVLSDVSIGDVLSIENKEIKEKFTKPPKHFTEDTLLKSMEIAGNDALEKGVEVERKGLGTPATRAGIIENLIFKGFVERDKKNLIATHKGISLVTIVADTFKSAETTAKWEMELADIAQGKSFKKEFLDAIENEIKEAVLTYRK
ncbi:hypothetical protein FUT84_06645 [Treponema phagedenis]|nr:hypothetical protein FUT79_06970 [Treponema phagedenis]QEK00878.1 hypothetical protein FUT84_06645 [Treponema phagedenis]QEK05886.1 hypothetical protein FUT80_03550 [Treponema phagedenis]